MTTEKVAKKAVKKTTRKMPAKKVAKKATKKAVAKKTAKKAPVKKAAKKTTKKTAVQETSEHEFKMRLTQLTWDDVLGDPTRELKLGEGQIRRVKAGKGESVVLQGDATMVENIRALLGAKIGELEEERTCEDRQRRSLVRMYLRYLNYDLLRVPVIQKR